MSDEQLSAFLDTVKADAGLQEKLKVAPDLDAAVAIAKEAGFTISVEGLKRSQAALSEEDLEKVSGGGVEQHFFVKCVGGPNQPNTGSWV